MASISSLLTIIRALEKQLKLRIFSYEYEIMVVLFDNGPTTAGDLLSQSSASSTAFYAGLKYLLVNNLIEGTTEANDRRRVRYSLTDLSHEAFHAINKQIYHWSKSVIDPTYKKPSGFTAFIRQIQGVMPLRYLANDYHILLLVYENGHINAGDLLHLTETSSTTFYVALRRLCDMGLLRAVKDGQDKRRTFYDVPASTRELMNEAHRQIHDYICIRLNIENEPHSTLV